MEQKKFYNKEEAVKIKLAQALLTNVELLREKAKLLVETERLTSEIKKMEEKMGIKKGGN